MPASPRSRSGAASNAAPAEGATAGESEPGGAAPDGSAPSKAAPSGLVQGGAAAGRAGPSDPATAESAEPESRDGVDDLSFREAQVALELVLSQLQAPDLDVEAMVRLHRRGQAYAERCETLLRQVEQEVRLWDPDDPDAEPQAYAPG